MTTFPLYGVTRIATELPMVQTALVVSISQQLDGGDVNTTFETLSFDATTYPPFMMTEADVKQLIATHYHTTVDHVRILPPQS